MHGAAQKDAGRIGERGGDAAEQDAQLAEQADLLVVQRMIGVSAQAKWLISSVKPWFSDLDARPPIATPSSGERPSRFMPVSTCSAAPPRQPVPATNASHSASSVVAVDDRPKVRIREGRPVRGITPSST